MTTLRTAALLTLSLLALSGGRATARIYYVRPDGNDGNPGWTNTPQGAWKTIHHAAESVKPGDTVEVQEGTYTGGIAINVRGEENLPITFLAVGKVVITTPAESQFGLAVQGRYLVIKGFDLSGGRYWAGSIFLTAGASHNTVCHNVIHDSERGVGVWQADDIPPAR